MLNRLARNAKLGDGNFWKHPESRHHCLVFTGTNYDWIAKKAALMGKEAKVIRKSGSSAEGVFANAKTLWQAKSDSNALFSEYAGRDVLDVLEEVDLTDMAWWFLDDGTTIERRDYVRKDGVVRYRYMLCLGDLFGGDEKLERSFLDIMKSKFSNYFDNTVGRISLNNSKASALNKTWQIPVVFGKVIVCEALKLNIPGFDKKLRFLSGGNFRD